MPLSDKHAPCMQCSLRSPPSPHSLRSPPRLCCSLAAHSSRSLRCPAAARLARVARRLACSVCSPRLPAVLASLAAACFCPARFACLLLLPRASLASALLTFTSPPPRLLLIHLAHLLCSLRSLLLASLAHCSLTARSLLAHCSLTARSLLSLCSPDSSPHPVVPLRHDCLAARGGKLRCDSPQSLSDPHTHPFCTTLPVPIFDPSGLMARARNLDQIARAPAPGINLLCAIAVTLRGPRLHARSTAQLQLPSAPTLSHHPITPKRHSPGGGDTHAQCGFQASVSLGAVL